jgi:ADP-ribose pyrophosphatase
MADDIKTLYNGRWLSMRTRTGWEFVERNNPGGAAIIVAATRTGHALLVEQYRVPIQSRTLEFPAGLIGDEHASEAAIESARRELLEETGYEAAQLEYLMGGPSSAGMSTEVMHFFRARGLERRHAGGGVAGENIVVHEVPIAQLHTFVAEKMRAGFAVDPKVYAGIHFLLFNLDGSPLPDRWWS